jgi:ankyrin repeat protein
MSVTPGNLGSLRRLGRTALLSASLWGLLAAGCGESPKSDPPAAVASTPTAAIPVTAPPAATEKAASTSSETLSSLASPTRPQDAAVIADGSLDSPITMDGADLPRRELIDATAARQRAAETRAATSDTAPAARRPGPAIRFEPEALELGEMVVEIPARGSVRLVNVTDAPVRIERSVPSCGCTALGTPAEPIAPGEYAEIEITMSPGSRPGIRMSKNITFVIEGYDSQVFTVGGNVTAYVAVSPDILNAPASPDDVSAAESGRVKVSSSDGTAFVVTASTPAVFKDLPQTPATEHDLEIDWNSWQDSRRPVRVQLATDHPKAPTVAFTVRRSLRDPNAPQTPPTAAARQVAPVASAAAGLITAARSGDLVRLRLELASGSEIDATDPATSRNALHWAANDGQTEVVALLIEAGASLGATERTGMTALTLAAKEGRTGAVAALLAAGADVNVRDQIGGSPLLWAAGLGNSATVAALLEAGAEVNVADVNGLTPLLWSTSIGRDPESVALLLAAGADPEQGERIVGDTPAIRAARNASPRPLELLIARGVDLKRANLRGVTPLMSAAGGGAAEQVRMLIAAGADPKAKDQRGWTSLDHALNRSDPNREAIVAILTPLAGDASAP